MRIHRSFFLEKVHVNFRPFESNLELHFLKRSRSYSQANSSNQMNLRRIFLFFAITQIIWITACKDQNAIVDTNQEIPERAWSYMDKIKVPVSIFDTTKAYNVYLNMRHSGDYKYSNIFLLVHEISPDHKTITERKEFKLALPDGEWLGKGSGNLYSYQVLFKTNYHFPKKGVYMFQLEQNMRDNPLREVTDAGIRVEVAK